MKRKWNAIVLFAVGVAIAFGLYVSFGPKPDDQVQIQNALQSAIEAGREGRPGSVLEQLSNSFEINGQQILNRTEVARFIRDQKPDVKVEKTLANVEGDFAVIETPITLEMSGPLKVKSTIPNVRIEFRREQSRTLLLFPSREWKLSRVEVPPESWAQMMLGL